MIFGDDEYEDAGAETGIEGYETGLRCHISLPANGIPAPEYAVDGRVSRPKDIWGLGCIFLEVLLWAVSGSTTAIEGFEGRRAEFSQFSPDKAPQFWCCGEDGVPCLNPAVDKQLHDLAKTCDVYPHLNPLLRAVRESLQLWPSTRPSAARLCELFHSMLRELQAAPAERTASARATEE